MRVDERFSAKYLDGWGDNSSFKKSAKIDKKDISVKETEKGEYIFANKILGSEKTITIL